MLLKNASDAALKSRSSGASAERAQCWWAAFNAGEVWGVVQPCSCPVAVTGTAAVIWGLERQGDAFGGGLKQNWGFSQPLKLSWLTRHARCLSGQKVFEELSVDL